jgi:hypothetical protein
MFWAVFEIIPERKILMLSFYEMINLLIKYDRYFCLTTYIGVCMVCV